MSALATELNAKIACFVFLSFAGLVVLAKRLNPIPSRTRPLNASAPMVLWLKPWESRSLPGLPRTRNSPLRCSNTNAPLRETEAALSFGLVSSDRAALAYFSRAGPLSSCIGIHDRHPDSFCRAHWHRSRIEILETKHVDSKMIRRRALAVEGVDAAA